MIPIPGNYSSDRGSIPPPGTLRLFHQSHPLAGEVPNAILSIPDDLLIYLTGVLRDIPSPPPRVSSNDWNNLLSLLRSHWIIPLVAATVAAWPEEYRPPPAVLSDLRQARLSGKARTILTGRQCSTIISALQEAGIPVLLIKGPALARTLYSDPSLRQSSDIDLLVKPRDFERCEEVMADLGYTTTARTFRISRHAFHHQAFLPHGPGVLTEIHWNPDFGFNFFAASWVDAAFDHKIAVSAQDLSFETMSPVDHLLYLVFHNMIQHNHVRLDWIGDIARLSRQLHAPEDWETLLSQSVQCHLRIPLELALQEAGLWMGSALPHPYSDPATWPEPSPRERRLWKYAITQETSRRSLMHLHLEGLPGIREKVDYCYRLIIPPAHLMTKYRSNRSSLDIPAAHVRRWISIVKCL
ncbi:MAG: nucleotidyltransferase family protein [Methanoregula sp.]